VYCVWLSLIAVISSPPYISSNYSDCDNPYNDLPISMLVLNESCYT